MIRILPLLLGGMALLGQEPPSWYRALQGLPGLEARFEQVGESAVFRSLKRQGTLQVSRGGRLRVNYDKGLQLVCDGRTLTQFDPLARSAQRLELQMALKDAPLLALLVDPGMVNQHYRIRSEGPKVVLEPLKNGMTPVELTGEGALLSSVTWTDGTGARQTLRLIKPALRREFPKGTFEAKLPAGTRWIH